MVDIRIRLTGDWSKLTKNLNVLQTKLDIEVDKCIKRVAEFLERLIKDGIGQGKFPYTHSEAWAVFKDEHGLDPRVLIATGQYIASIETKKIGMLQYSVGSAGGVHTSQNFGGTKVIGMQELAAILEDMIPHFFPTYMNDVVAKQDEIKMKFSEFLVALLKAQGIDVTVA